MVKRIFFIFLLCITILPLCSEEAEHNRIKIDNNTKLKIEMDLSSRMKFQFISGYNIYDLLPQLGFNFVLFEDYILSVSQSISLRMKESTPIFGEKPFSAHVAFNDTNVGFVWQPSYQRWRFRLGLTSTFPTAPWTSKTGRFVTGSGRFGEEIFFAANYITDPVVIGGRLSYTFVSPQLKDVDSGWIPCILTSSLQITAVLNNNISVSCVPAISWNSGPLQNARYIPGQSSLTESIKLNFSWTESTWSISTELELLHSEGVFFPIWAIAFSSELYGK